MEIKMVNRVSPYFQEDVLNSLGEQTGWSSHELFVVYADDEHRYNDITVKNVITIAMPDSNQELEDYLESRDLDDVCFDKEIVTTAEGARKLAATLIKAADAAETKES
jgi:hypothetical protein